MYRSFNARAVGLTLTAAETVELAAEAGFGGVDLLVRDIVESGEDPKLIRSRMDDLGLRGGAWPLPVDWRGDAARFSEDLARLDGYARAARTLGLHRTGTWVMPETPDRPPHEDAESIAAYLAACFDFHVERLGSIARVLARHECRLGLEVIGVETSRTGRGIPFLHRLADLGPLMALLAAGAPNLGVLVDGFHLYAAGESPEAGLSWGIDRVVWVHVADLPASALADQGAIFDSRRGLPGENGAVDSRGLLECLQGLGYDGPVTAEPLAGCRSLEGLTPAGRARKVAEALRRVWPPPA